MAGGVALLDICDVSHTGYAAQAQIGLIAAVKRTGEVAIDGFALEQ